MDGAHTSFLLRADLLSERYWGKVTARNIYATDADTVDILGLRAEPRRLSAAARAWNARIAVFSPWISEVAYENRAGSVA